MNKKIGLITHYFGHIGVAVVKLSENLKVGDKIHIIGATSDLKETVDSMQIDHKSIEVAKKGQSIGLKVKSRVREQDKVFLIN